LTLIRASWTFNVDYSQFILAGVIWMLGWCMILLAGLVWLPAWAIGTFGLVVMVCQNVFTPLGGLLPASWQTVWEFIYPVGAEVKLGTTGPTVTVLYTIVPWIGVMAAGYAFGTIVTREPTARRRLCLRIGLSATALFLLVAGLGVVLRPAPDGAPPAIIRLLNQQKYPASQLFLLMTLGPAIALLTAAERARGWFATVLATFGRVPMFYYIAHIYLIHVLAIVAALAFGQPWKWLLHGVFILNPLPQGYGHNLPFIYLMWLTTIVLLYFPCRWFAGVKRRRRDSWLGYI
jgi:uncharacterized membrane protein